MLFTTAVTFFPDLRVGPSRHYWGRPRHERNVEELGKYIEQKWFQGNKIIAKTVTSTGSR